VCAHQQPIGRVGVDGEQASGNHLLSNSDDGRGSDQQCKARGASVRSRGEAWEVNGPCEARTRDLHGGGTIAADGMGKLSRALASPFIADVPWRTVQGFVPGADKLARAAVGQCRPRCRRRRCMVARRVVARRLERVGA
jgi:hypothetical protein